MAPHTPPLGESSGGQMIDLKDFHIMSIPIYNVIARVF